MTLGYNGNHTESCEPRLKDKVNIGVYCSCNPSLAVLKLRQCAFTVRAHLIPETVYDGYKANLPIAPAGTMGNDDSVPSYDLQNGLAGPSDTQKDNAIHHFKILDPLMLQEAIDTPKSINESRRWWGNGDQISREA